MKAILISIKPKWYVEIMNGDKTIEVRKNKALYKAIQKLIDENGYADIYVYCSKGKLGLYDNRNHITCASDIFFLDKLGYDKPPLLNGKVIFKFRCYKVDEWDIWQEDLEEKLKFACLSIKEFDDYSKGQIAYAIHINDLEIFDKPKELSEFRFVRPTKIKNFYYSGRLTNAPQNFCYVEVSKWL